MDNRIFKLEKFVRFWSSGLKLNIRLSIFYQKRLENEKIRILLSQFMAEQAIRRNEACSRVCRNGPMARKPGDPALGSRPRREAPAKRKQLEAGPGGKCPPSGSSWKPAPEGKRLPNGSGWKPVPKRSVCHPEVGWKPVDGGKRPQSRSRSRRGEFPFQVVV